MYLTSALEYLLITSAFHEKRLQENQGSSNKVIFIVKRIVYMAFGFTIFVGNLLTQWHLRAICPLIAATDGRQAQGKTWYFQSKMMQVRC